MTQRRQGSTCEIGGCQSDFTHCRELNVRIDGQAFPHLIYHFVLSYSNWETGSVCYSETFESLSEGLQISFMSRSIMLVDFMFL